METTRDKQVSAILEQYSDTADVMEIFWVKRMVGYSVRSMLTKAPTLEWAGRVHRLPLNEFLDRLRKAVATKNE